MEPQISTVKHTSVREAAHPTTPHKKIKTTITTVTSIETEEVQEAAPLQHAQRQIVATTDNQTSANERILKEQIRILQQQLDSMHKAQHTSYVSSSATPSVVPASIQSASHGSSQPTSSQQPSISSSQPGTSNQNSQESTVDVTTNQPIAQNNILEKGLIYFFYRPKIGVELAKDMNDVQRFFILLQSFPDQNQKSFNRLLRIGKKKLPSLHEHNRFWGIVEEATEDMTKIDALLGDQSYSTITRGERQLHSCIPVGEGVYALVQTNGFCHLAYVLENPIDLGSVQNAFNIEHQGSYIVSVKNPLMPNQPANTTTAGLPLNQRPASQQLPESPVKVQFPPDIQSVFQGRRFAPAIPKEMLNFKGAEIVVIGETNRNPILYSEEFRKIEQELGIESQHHLKESALYEELKAQRPQQQQPVQ